jgi:hypothetical protein
MPAKTLKTCDRGHQFYKSSDCPTCPICASLDKPEGGFLSLLSAPARGALVHAGITTLAQLSQYSEREILKLHGVGPRSVPTLRQALDEVGMSFVESAKKR